VLDLLLAPGHEHIKLNVSHYSSAPERKSS
jgi:hypothetical protein